MWPRDKLLIIQCIQIELTHPPRLTQCAPSDMCTGLQERVQRQQCILDHWKDSVCYRSGLCEQLELC
jgi:hypothetical protein